MPKNIKNPSNSNDRNFLLFGRENYALYFWLYRIAPLVKKFPLFLCQKNLVIVESPAKAKTIEATSVQTSRWSPATVT